MVKKISSSDIWASFREKRETKKVVDRIKKKDKFWLGQWLEKYTEKGSFWLSDKKDNWL